jgi:hypothetical protein
LTQNPPSAKGTSKELEDILGTSVSSGPNIPPVQNDPWAAFDNTVQANSTNSNVAMIGMVSGNTRSESANIGQQRGNVKTPESFLGGWKI